MDGQVPAVYNLPPELAHHVFKHLSKRDKQQFALCCKHTCLCALAAVKSVVLSHKCLAQGKPLKLKMVRSSVKLQSHPGWCVSRCLYAVMLGASAVLAPNLGPVTYSM
jgi:hypothetical protein